MKYFSLIILTVFVFASCKKNRECECKNSNGTYVAGEIEATKRNAKKYCEGLSGSATDCYLK